MSISNLVSWQSLAVILVALLFIIFGESVGWRAVGVLQLLFSVDVLRQKEVPVGWEGQEPSFIVRGHLAFLAGLVSLGVSVMLLFFPEQTVMKWGQ